MRTINTEQGLELKIILIASKRCIGFVGFILYRAI